jgi:ribulose-5-phosphate 4-epimerase/fuculose-1-phosphate aldolase
MMSNDANSLVELCKHIGNAVPFWTQGAGSNISEKRNSENSTELWIKASGFRLDQVTEHKGLACVDLAFFKAKLAALSVADDSGEEKYSDLLKTSPLPNKSQGRPSMETGFHAILPQKYVLHFHSLASLLMGHLFNKDAQKFSAWMDKHWQGTFCFIPIARPGLSLTLDLADNVESSLLLLQNHGVILQSDSASILSKWAVLESTFLRSWGFLDLQKLSEASPPFDKNFTETLVPTPFRIYFPDTAVFRDRILNILETAELPGSKEPHFIPKKDAINIDLDALELWAATAILFATCPELEEVPADMAEKISGLPSEKFRMAMHQNRTPS